MLYLLTLVAAVVLAGGQALWKTAAVGYPKLITEGIPTFRAAITVLLSPSFIFGAILYVIATLIYLWLFSKYPYYQVQIILVSFSILASLMISRFIFKETFNLVNLVGMLLIIAGAALVTWKK